MTPFHPNNKKAQDIARAAISQMHKEIQVGMSEADIYRRITQLMTEAGSNTWWYHGLPALVLVGERSRLSVSGRVYVPSETTFVQETDFISIDTAPGVDGSWGDYARTFFMENGQMATEDQPTLPDFREGLEAELHLHRFLLEHCKPSMTYEEVYRAITQEIHRLGFVNLDFHGNLGHSIEEDEKDRICLEEGSTTIIDAHGKPFTLEPHIAHPKEGHGFKRENIYWIDGDHFVEL